MRGPVTVVVVSLFLFHNAVAQNSAVAKPYNVAEAYRIYSLLLPHEESYGFAKDTLMIQEMTVAEDVSGACLTQADTNTFKGAIAGYKRVYRKKWLLRRHFQIEKAYRIVGPDVISTRPDRPQSSGAYVMMSPVGFNPEKTQAIVYMGSSCGGLCGSWRFHLLEKVHGSWKEVPVATCVTAS
jgi:hypothetical protein